MKTKLTLLIISILFLSACSTTYYSSIPYDDVYYNGQQAQIAANNQTNNSDYNEVEVNEGEYNSEYAQEEQEDYPGYYNDFNAYYNYLFSARIRRFHRPYYSYGYYNNYFTNMYWYDMNPYLWGSSIYLNSGWMMPYGYGGWSGNFYAGLIWGFSGYNMGWPYYNYGWPYGFGYNNYYGIGYNYFYPSFYGYGYGYAHNYYYNSRDRYSQYYTHRPSRGRNYNRPNGTLNTTFGEMYEKRYYASREDRNLNNNSGLKNKDSKSFNNTSLSVGTPATGRNRSNTTIANGSAGGTLSTPPYSRLNNASENTTTQKKVVNQNIKTYTKPQVNRNNIQNTNTVKSYQKPVLKYSKPNTFNSPNSRNSNARQYATPQEYADPGTRMNRSSTNRTQINNTVKSLKRVITAPSRSNKSYTSPSRSNTKPISILRSSSSGNKIISSPGKSLSTPTRSSSRSFSSPTKSSTSSGSSIKSSGTSTRSSSGGSGRVKR